MTVTLLPGGENGLTATDIVTCERILINAETNVAASRAILTPRAGHRVTVFGGRIFGVQGGAATDGIAQITLFDGTTAIAIGAMADQNQTVWTILAAEFGGRPYQLSVGGILKMQVTVIGAATTSTYSGWLDVAVGP